MYELICNMAIDVGAAVAAAYVYLAKLVTRAEGDRLDEIEARAAEGLEAWCRWVTGMRL